MNVISGQISAPSTASSLSFLEASLLCPPSLMPPICRELVLDEIIVTIGIIGFSGSGKSTFARRVGATYGAAVISLDYFLRERGQRPGSSLWDKYDFQEAAAVIARLQAGQPVEIVAFSQRTRKREVRIHISPPQRIVIRSESPPVKVIVVEGILVSETIRQMLDLVVWMDTPEDVCLERQRKRLEEEEWYKESPKADVIKMIEDKRTQEHPLIREQHQFCDIAIANGDALDVQRILDEAMCKILAPA